MADEITLNFRFDVVSGTYRPGAINISGLQIDQAVGGDVGGAITVTTAETVTLSKTGLTDPGLLYMRNIDTNSTKVIAWGFTTGELHALLPAGEFALVRTSTAAAVYAQHTVGTGGARLHYRWLEN
jgi:hypothetical protein